MMKKNLLNKHVVKAISLGLSAVMLTTPMQAMAAEGTDIDATGADDSNITEESSTEASVCDAAQDAAEAVAVAVETADTSKEVLKADIDQNVEAGEVIAEDGTDLSQAVRDELMDDTDLSSENKENYPTDVDTALADVDTELKVAEASDAAAEAELDKAEAEVVKAETAAGDANDAMDAAKEAVKVDIANIENATTIADANAAYAELQQEVSDAQTTFDEKLEEYNTAKEAFATAKDAAEVAKAAYDAAVANAEGDAAAAEAALNAAKAEADKLEAAVAAAKKAVGVASAAAMDIAEKEELTQTDGGLNWKNEDKLFISIMENYYLPEELGIKGAVVKRVQGKDNNDYNYFTATYTDENGHKQVKFFNYKMDNNNKDKDDIVIFEKREVEVNWDKASVENPDYYLDEQKNKISPEELEAGLGTKYIAVVNGDTTTYYEMNEKTTEAEFPASTEITGTSTEDVTVGEKTETYKIDADGQLVKEVTADVTTVTYTGKTFTSDLDYTKEAKRDAAAAAKEAELESATGKDATVVKTKETTTTYVATGTYIPTFTDTVNVWNQEVEKGWTFWDDANSDAEAVDYVYNEKLGKYNDEDSYYIINKTNGLHFSGYSDEEKNWIGITTDDSDYLVSGTASVTYAKVTKTTVDKNTFGAMWDDLKSLFGSGDSANEKLTKAAKAVIEAAGGIFVSAKWADWDWNKATISYVAAVAVEGEEETTVSDATQSVKDAASAKAEANKTGVYNVKVGATEEIETTTYSYKVNYLEKASENTETVSVITEAYANAETLKGEITQNLNWLKGLENPDGGYILLTQNDKDYRDFVDNAKNLTDKYERLLGEAQDAQEDVATAQKAVDTLQDEISNLKQTGANLDELKDLETKLLSAEAELKDAEGKLEELNGQLEDAAEILDGVIDALTPDPVDDGGDDADDGDDDTTPTTPVVVPVVTPEEIPTAVVTPAGGAGAGAGAAVVDIEDEETPLAAGIDNGNGDANGGDGEDVIVASAEEDETAIVAIEDEETPLAAGSGADGKMSWWWLLIVALLGATGYKMYKEHQKKKEEAAQEA